MNAAKMTLTATVVAAFGLALGLAATPAQAHHCKGAHASEPGCDVGGGGGGSEKNFPAKVTFDDLDGDNITSYGNASYIDGEGVKAGVPLEGSPPGQFSMTLVPGEGRFLFMDFGAAEDCELDDGLQGCVVDDSAAVDPVLVLCPFPVGERADSAGTTNDALCSGLKQVRMFFRHALNVVAAGDEIFMLGMPNDSTFDGEADSVEFRFRAEKNVGGWFLRFDDRCVGIDGLGEFLEITAADHDANDDAVLPNDEWQIGTGAGTKTACLTKTVRGRSEDLIGLFDMQFGYKVCILADPGVSDDCIGE